LFAEWNNILERSYLFRGNDIGFSFYLVKSNSKIKKHHRCRQQQEDTTKGVKKAVCCFSPRAAYYRVLIYKALNAILHAQVKGRGRDGCSQAT
jgi:hypothetical protein